MQIPEIPKFRAHNYCKSLTESREELTIITHNKHFTLVWNISHEPLLSP